VYGRPSDYGLDDDITVQLRNKAGTTILDSKKVVVERREGGAQRRSGQKSLALRQKERSVSTTNAMETISLPLSFPKMESFNPQANFRPTTPVNRASLAIPSTWLNWAVRPR